jgi:hypothetical protein
MSVSSGPKWSPQIVAHDCTGLQWGVQDVAVGPISRKEVLDGQVRRTDEAVGSDPRGHHTTGASLNGSDPWDEALSAIEFLPECSKRSGYNSWGGSKLFHAPMPQNRSQAVWHNAVNAGGFGPFALPKDQPQDDFCGGTAGEGPDHDFPDVRNAAVNLNGR